MAAVEIYGNSPVSEFWMSPFQSPVTSNAGGLVVWRPRLSQANETFLQSHKFIFEEFVVIGIRRLGYYSL